MFWWFLNLWHSGDILISFNPLITVTPETAQPFTHWTARNCPTNKTLCILSFTRANRSHQKAVERTQSEESDAPKHHEYLLSKVHRLAIEFTMLSCLCVVHTIIVCTMHFMHINVYSNVEHAFFAMILPCFLLEGIYIVKEFTYYLQVIQTLLVISKGRISFSQSLFIGNDGTFEKLCAQGFRAS